MMIEYDAKRAIGTMVAYGYAEVDFGSELAVARRIGAALVEILPDWRAEPDPHACRRQVADAGLSIHSAHGCWGAQSIRAPRVDLGHTDPDTHRSSVDDLKRCIDWLEAADGHCLVVHPGGLSDPEQWVERRAALGRGLLALAEHARGTSVLICVENMPPGVFPGSRMADLTDLLEELGNPGLALALDTGHANITTSAASETSAAGRWLRTTHVHDNDGRQDTHLPPGQGNVNWDAWAAALDAIDYRGPIMLECIRVIRKQPGAVDAGLLERVARRNPPRTGSE
jgi:sugar phosphate isomerase/epimerase